MRSSLTTTRSLFDHLSRSRLVLCIGPAINEKRLSRRNSSLPVRLTGSYPKSFRYSSRWIGHIAAAAVGGRIGAGVKAIVVGGGQIWDDRTDKRARTEATQEANKRRKLNGEAEDLPVYATRFSKEEIEAEGKKPKRKVAVMLGYSGLQALTQASNHHEKTIEGDLFSAFVAAGAISKANADDPKKSSLVRCARTDRGVHAAGNVISLKMIIEDPDIVKKINTNLLPQIRVWGIERTNGSFSAYQLCDSRIYEYLIPTYCFLPPHPDSFLGKELFKLAEEASDSPGYQDRQNEVSNFWAETEEKHMQPFLDSLDSELAASVRKALYDAEPKTIDIQSDAILADTSDSDEPGLSSRPAPVQVTAEFPDIGSNGKEPATEQDPSSNEDPKAVEPTSAGVSRPDSGVGFVEQRSSIPEVPKDTDKRSPVSALEAALRNLKNVIISAKKAYRIHPTRLARLQSVLSQYIGTHNFHNYTISKAPRDPSAKRVIKSFSVAPEPILINNTEWLSLKVHGQSFMMHQIRKMVTMATLIVRCGCPESRMQESYGHERLIVPKAPSLGLLLERPVFETYNEKMRVQGGEERAEIGFNKYEKEVQEFKQREIYERIFREEERDDTFHSFFASLDNVRTPDLLYLSSVGIPVVKKELPQNEDQREQQLNTVVSEDEGGADEQEGTRNLQSQGFDPLAPFARLHAQTITQPVPQDTWDARPSL
ncbi:MAG: hypothetical protein Q9181_006028 [Wetmoreana brouardii]